MLSALLFATCLFQQNRAVPVLNDLIATLESGNLYQVTVKGEREIGGVAKPITATVYTNREPFKYWARTETEDGESYACLVGTKMKYSEDDGHRVVIDVPTVRIVVNDASPFGLYAWDTFCDVDRYRSSLDGKCFYVHAEEIEGHPCDLVGIIKSTTATETMSNIRFVWVDRETHLPRAYQIHSLIRGHSVLGPKWTITSITRDAKYFRDPFADIPAQAHVKVSHAEPAAPVMREMKPGAACPSWPVETVDGKSASLSSLVHGPTLVTFWASWCGPCRAELDALKNIPAVRNGRIKVVAIGVSDSKANLRGFMKKGNPLFHYYLDPDAELSSSKLNNTFSESGIPHAYLFDGKGKLIRQWLGFESQAELAKQLKLP